MICASRNTSRRAPRISGSSGSAKRTASARLASTARPREDIDRVYGLARQLESSAAPCAALDLKLPALNSKLASRAVLAAFAFTTVFFTGLFAPFSNPNELSRLETVYAAVELSTLRIDGAIPRARRPRGQVGRRTGASTRTRRPASRSRRFRSTASCAPSSRRRARRPTRSSCGCACSRCRSVCILALARFLRRVARAAVGRARRVRGGVRDAVSLLRAQLLLARVGGVAALPVLGPDPARAGARGGAGACRSSTRRRDCSPDGRPSRSTRSRRSRCSSPSRRGSLRRTAPFAAGRRRRARGPSRLRRRVLRLAVRAVLRARGARRLRGSRGARALRIRVAEPVHSAAVALRSRARAAALLALLALAPSRLRGLAAVARGARRRPLGARRGRGIPDSDVRVSELARRLVARLPVPPARALSRRARPAARALGTRLARPLRDRRRLLGLRAPGRDGVVAALSARICRGLRPPDRSGSCRAAGSRRISCPAPAPSRSSSRRRPRSWRADSRCGPRRRCSRRRRPSSPPRCSPSARPWRSAPRPSFPARLWRAAIFGAYSGLDPQRQELRRVVLEAATPAEQRQARGAWRLYGAGSER